MATVAQAHSPIIVLLQGRSTIELSAYATALADTASYLPSARIMVLPNDSVHRYSKSNTITISLSTVSGYSGGRSMAQVALQLLR